MSKNLTELDHARFASWLLGELFCLAPNDSPEEQALNRASIEQELRVLCLEIAADFARACK